MNIATSEAQFDPAWWAAQPPAVRAFQNQPSTPTNQAQLETELVNLAHQGYIIDPLVLLRGWSPWAAANYAIEFGYTWRPSILMPPVSLAPGLSQGGVAPYDPTMIPVGAIIVTLDLDLLPSLFPTPKGVV